MLFECIQVAALRRASILIACSALLLAVVYDDADCSVVLVAVPVLGGCANYT